MNSPSPSAPIAAHGAQRGSVLIVVVGLAALMLTVVVVITRQLRVDVEDGILVLRDAQARMMLPSALGYLLEYGRLGGGRDGECFGWTDVRDGGVGPRGPAVGGSLPPEVGGSTWPALGTTYRADLHVQARPRFAIRPTRAYNPVVFPQAWIDEYEQAEDPSATFLWKVLRPQVGASREIGFLPTNTASDRRAIHWYWTNEDEPILTDTGMAEHWGRVWTEILRPMDEFQDPYHHSLTPQPIADDWAGFRTADRAARTGTTNLSWFRIYRERPGDHDGNGSPWFDTVPLSGHGVFIITCGAGASGGYRDWAEVQAAGDTDRFLGDPEMFADLRAQERLLWFRVEWSPFTSGGFNFTKHYRLDFHTQHNNDPVVNTGLNADYSSLHIQTPVRGGSADQRNSGFASLNCLGTIKWIERLEHEPTDGARPGEGRGLW